MRIIILIKFDLSLTLHKSEIKSKQKKLKKRQTNIKLGVRKLHLLLWDY